MYIYIFILIHAYLSIHMYIYIYTYYAIHCFTECYPKVEVDMTICDTPCPMAVVLWLPTNWSLSQRKACGLLKFSVAALKLRRQKSGRV